MSLLGVTVCLCVSVETFNCFHFFFGGESFVVFLFCFYFVKLMIHIVLEPPATIKTVKSYSGSYSSFLIYVPHRAGRGQNNKPHYHCKTLQEGNTLLWVHLLSIHKLYKHLISCLYRTLMQLWSDFCICGTPQQLSWQRVPHVKRLCHQCCSPGFKSDLWPFAAYNLNVHMI